MPCKCLQKGQNEAPRSQKAHLPRHEAWLESAASAGSAKGLAKTGHVAFTPAWNASTAPGQYGQARLIALASPSRGQLFGAVCKGAGVALLTMPSSFHVRASTRYRKKSCTAQRHIFRGTKPFGKRPAASAHPTQAPSEAWPGGSFRFMAS